tara:strand:- start:658 stop:933 length:276 start_codon:yes stop_codon:yes gene_type:complete
MAAKRNYKNEYAKFQSSPKAIKDRAARNKARKNALKVGKVKKGDGKDLHHPSGPRSKKTVVMSASKNRGIKEKSRKKGSKRNYPKTRKKAK